MPKQKTHSGAKKRFALKKSGVIKRNKQNRRHILTKKSQDRKRGLRKATYVSKADQKNVKGLLVG
ncbi:MAG: 50S ribosomal protein L35 [Clostridiales bacterium]|nr:50S ribosomal protein L35 [Clostridiales bacterium]